MNIFQEIEEEYFNYWKEQFLNSHRDRRERISNSIFLVFKLYGNEYEVSIEYPSGSLTIDYGQI